MRTFNNKKNRDSIILKFGEIIFSALTKSALQVKASICYTVKEKLLLFCHNFSTFAITVYNLTFIDKSIYIIKKNC